MVSEQSGLEKLEEIELNEPALFDELTTKRSTTYKDPSKSVSSEQSMWRLNHFPTKQLDKLIRPSIMKMAEQACERILTKIDNEQRMEEMRTQWLAD